MDQHSLRIMTTQTFNEDESKDYTADNLSMNGSSLHHSFRTWVVEMCSQSL